MAEPTKQEMPARSRKRLWLYLLLLFLLLNWDYPHNQIYYHYKCKNESGDRVYGLAVSDPILLFDWTAVECGLMCLAVLSSQTVEFVEVISIETPSDLRNLDDLSSFVSNVTASVHRYNTVNSNSEFCAGKEVHDSFDYYGLDSTEGFSFCLNQASSSEITATAAIENVRTSQTFFTRVTQHGYRLFALSDGRTISSSYEFRLWPVGLKGILSRILPIQLQETRKCDRSVNEAGRLTNTWLVGAFEGSEVKDIAKDGGEI